MKKTITTLLVLVTAILTTYAQVIPNADFEDWSPSPTTLMWNYPTGWTTTNAMTEFIGAGVRRVTPGQSGDSACELSTMILFGDTAPAAMVNGAAELNYPKYELVYDESGSSITSAYHYMHGYYKFSSTSTDDSALVTVVYRNWNSSAGKTDTVATFTKLLPEATTFTEFQVDMSAIGTDEVDTVVIIFYSTNPENKKAGGKLIVDNLSMDMINSTGHYPSKVELNIYPNPAINLINITTASNEQISKVNIVDITGKTVISKDYNSTLAIQLELSNINTGIYFVQVTTSKGIATKKLTVIK